MRRLHWLYNRFHASTKQTVFPFSSVGLFDLFHVQAQAVAQCCVKCCQVSGQIDEIHVNCEGWGWGCLGVSFGMLL